MYESTGMKTFEASAAFSQYARVIVGTDGKIAAAGLTEIGDGIAMRAAFAVGDPVSVKLWSAPGTFLMIASEALDTGDVLYTDADGKVQDTATSTSFKFAKCLEAASADGAIVECVLLHAAGVTAVA